MDSIVFYQPPSPKWPSHSALNKPVPEPIYDEDDGWEAPSISEILAEAKQKRAGVPVHQDCPPLIRERTNDGGLPEISQMSARAAIEDHVSAHLCSLCSGNTQQKNLSIAPHADPELSQSTRCQRNPAIVAPKALEPISQDEGTYRPAPLDVDDQTTYKKLSPVRKTTSSTASETSALQAEWKSRQDLTVTATRLMVAATVDRT